MNGRAVSAPIVLKGTHFEQAPALPGLPGFVTARPFGSGGRGREGGAGILFGVNFGKEVYVSSNRAAV